jgi:hypothetical protein
VADDSKLFSKKGKRPDANIHVYFVLASYLILLEMILYEDFYNLFFFFFGENRNVIDSCLQRF